MSKVKCPGCNGIGWIWTHEWVSKLQTCKICNGVGVIGPGNDFYERNKETRGWHTTPPKDE